MSGVPARRQLPRRGAASLRLLLDLLRPGATSLGVVVPLVVLLTLVALVVAVVGEVVVPWAIYPAL
jgi:hypothetical protein